MYKALKWVKWMRLTVIEWHRRDQWWEKHYPIVIR